jgi:hypothetical protein
LFFACAAVILSFYGGGIRHPPGVWEGPVRHVSGGRDPRPAADGSATAGVLGPLIVNAVTDSGKSAGRSGPDLYSTSFFAMIGLLAGGFAANELIRPVRPRHPQPSAAGAQLADGRAASGPAPADTKGAEQ